MFCPAYPLIIYGTTEDLVKNSQTDFYALDMKETGIDLRSGEESTLINLPLRTAEKHRTLTHLASVWDYQNERIIDDLSVPGPRVVNFSNILKYDYFPLSEILMLLLDISQKALGIPVEIEFAVDLSKNLKEKILPTFYLLQVRPLSVNTQDNDIDVDKINFDDLLLYSNRTLGNGVLENISDVVFINPDNFDKTRTVEMQREIEQLNSFFKEEKGNISLSAPAGGVQRTDSSGFRFSGDR